MTSFNLSVVSTVDHAGLNINNFLLLIKKHCHCVNLVFCFKRIQKLFCVKCGLSPTEKNHLD